VWSTVSQDYLLCGAQCHKTIFCVEHSVTRLSFCFGHFNPLRTGGVFTITC